MKCKKCNGEFTPPKNISITKCPFCNELLIDISDIKKEIELHNLLLNIAEQYEQNILREKRLLGLLNDLMPSLDLAYKRVFKMSVEYNIGHKVLELKSEDEAIRKAKINILRSSFKTSHGLSNTADYIFDCYLYALGWIGKIDKDSYSKNTTDGLSIINRQISLALADNILSKEETILIFEFSEELGIDNNIIIELLNNKIIELKLKPSILIDNLLPKKEILCSCDWSLNNENILYDSSEMLFNDIIVIDGVEYKTNIVDDIYYTEIEQINIGESDLLINLAFGKIFVLLKRKEGNIVVLNDKFSTSSHDLFLAFDSNGNACIGKRAEIIYKKTPENVIKDPLLYFNKSYNEIKYILENIRTEITEKNGFPLFHIKNTVYTPSMIANIVIRLIKENISTIVYSFISPRTYISFEYPEYIEFQKICKNNFNLGRVIKPFDLATLQLINLYDYNEISISFVNEYNNKFFQYNYSFGGGVIDSVFVKELQNNSLLNSEYHIDDHIIYLIVDKNKLDLSNLERVKFYQKKTVDLINYTLNGMSIYSDILSGKTKDLLILSLWRFEIGVDDGEGNIKILIFDNYDKNLIPTKQTIKITPKQEELFLFIKYSTNELHVFRKLKIENKFLNKKASLIIDIDANYFVSFRINDKAVEYEDCNILYEGYWDKYWNGKGIIHNNEKECVNWKGLTKI